MKNIIEVSDLTKQYPGFKLNKINMTVPSGTVMGLIGENGAGKTTLIKAILNIVRTDTGKITIFGEDHVTAEKTIKEKIGVVMDDAFFADTLKINEIVSIASRLYHHWDQPKFNDLCQRFDLTGNKPVKQFSKGMRKKLEIAVALAHDAQLLILDEPTSGLDPVIRSEILDILRDFIQDETKGILISSHITSDLEHIADYITFIDHGQLIFTNSMETLHEDYGIVKCGADMFAAFDPRDIVSYKHYAYNYDVLIKERSLVEKKYPGITIDRPSLEDIMLLYIKGDKSK